MSPHLLRGWFFYAQTIRQTIEISDSMIEWIEGQGVSTAIVLALMKNTKCKKKNNTHHSERVINQQSQNAPLGKTYEALRMMKLYEICERGHGMNKVLV